MKHEKAVAVVDNKIQTGNAGIDSAVLMTIFYQTNFTFSSLLM